MFKKKIIQAYKNVSFIIRMANGLSPIRNINWSSASLNFQTYICTSNKLFISKFKNELFEFDGTLFGFDRALSKFHGTLF